MRINKYVAQALGIGRRKADELILRGEITLNGKKASIGQLVHNNDDVKVNGSALQPKTQPTTVIALHKPTGYVCSKNGQGAATIYDLLPGSLSQLKPIGRLDKDSSGLLLLSDDGELIEQLTHPRYQKQKTYEVWLDKPLAKKDYMRITEQGVVIDDKKPSKLSLMSLPRQTAQTSAFVDDCRKWAVVMREGRNRQIRKTFSALNYRVTRLHRKSVGPYRLNRLPAGRYVQVDTTKDSHSISV